MNRRVLLKGATAVALLPIVVRNSPIFAGELPTELSELLHSSRLVYLTPIKSDGNESRCQGEVWYVYHNGKIYVNTQAEAWRVDAVRKGLLDTRMWVGEFGLWQRSEGAYKKAPRIMSKSARVVTDPAEHAELFPVFGAKYSDEWPQWGPRFKNGLADGSRTLLEYSAISHESFGA